MRYDARSDLVLAPAAGASPTRLLALCHGAGSGPQAMASVANRLAERIPAAAVVSLAGPLQAPPLEGRFWFPLQGVTEDNRPDRVALALPGFLAALRHWQHQTGLDAAATTLIGFSQGATLILEASVTIRPAVAHAVAALAGRFARLPAAVDPAVQYLLLHGESDRVIAPAHSLVATEHLQKMRCKATTQCYARLGHAISASQVGKLTDWILALEQG